MITFDWVGLMKILYVMLKSQIYVIGCGYPVKKFCMNQVYIFIIGVEEICKL